jgi:PAS domain S-box-containing protein
MINLSAGGGMQFISYLHFFCAIVYCFLAAFVFVRNPRSLLNRVCAMILLCFCVWSFGLTFVENPWVSKQTATLFQDIGSIGWLLFSAFFLWFVALFVGAKSVAQSRLFVVSLFVIPCVLIVCQWSGHLLQNLAHSPFGWRGSWARSLWTILFYGYYSAHVLSGFGLLVNFMRKTSQGVKRHEAQILLITGVIPFVCGSMTNVVLSQMHIATVPAMGDIFVLIWASGMVYSISKYRFLSITPMAAAEAIIDTMTDMLLLLDFRRRIISVNRATLEVLGYDSEDLEGGPIESVFPEAHLLDSVITEGVLVDPEQVFVDKSGKQIPVSLTASLIKGAGIAVVARDIGLQKIAKDALQKSRDELDLLVQARTQELHASNEELRKEIEERKKTEGELKNSEERLKVLFEYAPDACYLNDLKGTFVEGNRKAEEITGYQRHELIGKNFLQLQLLPASQLAKAAALLAKNAMGIPTGPDEFVLNRKEGGQISLEISTYPVRIADKKLVLGIARDVSERKRSEGEKSQLEAQLRQAQKMEAIGLLAGGIAHDFNNMLGAIVGYADMLKLKHDKSNPDVAKSATRILEASRNMADLTTKLLAFARRGKYEILPVDVRDVVLDVVKLVEHTFDKRIKIAKNFKAPASMVMGDRAQLQNAVLNLAVNARDAMPDGGKLTFATDIFVFTDAHTKSYPYAIVPGRYVLLSVADTGIGMDETVKNRLFEPFFTTKEKGKGTGLGLASVYGTVKSHNGYIEVDSEAGKGATFRIYLPLVDAPSQAKPEDRAAVQKGRGTILVVDDEELVREMCQEILTDMGYTVTVSKDGEDAARYYREHFRTIDLVVIDLIMPRLGGRECFHKIKKINPAIRAIIMSGYALDGEAKQIIDEGALGYIQKPFDVTSFSKAVKDAMGPSAG